MKDLEARAATAGMMLGAVAAKIRNTVRLIMMLLWTIGKVKLKVRVATLG